MAIQVEVWGDYACFTRPEMKTERVSYDIMTPSAARGLVEAIYWHPGMKYHIDRIYLLKPVQFASIRRNEVKATLLSSAALSAAKGGEVPMLCTAERRIPPPAETSAMVMLCANIFCRLFISFFSFSLLIQD